MECEAGLSRYYVDNKTYIDEEVYLYLLFPDKKIYGECILFDLYNIEMQEMTLEEHIEHAMNDIRNVENMVFHIGDYVLDAIEPEKFMKMNIQIALLFKERRFNLLFRRFKSN